MKNKRGILLSCLLIILGLTTSCIEMKSDSNKIPIEESNYAYESSEASGLDDIIYKNIAELEEEILINYDKKVTPKDVIEELKSAMHGKYHWGIIDGNINVEVETRPIEESSNISIDIGYIHTRVQEEDINRRVEDINGQIIEVGMSDSEKIQKIYDFIVTNSKYASEDMSKPGSISIYSPYSILERGIGVCQAYALLNYKMLENAGIEVIYITGEAGYDGNTENHAWNLVYLNGQWYHSDPTWGDPIPDMRGRVSYDYYMKDDMEFRKTHSWEEELYPRATGVIN